VDESIARLDPGSALIGVTSMFTYQWNVVKDLLAAIKAARPDALLVGGGEHFTGLPEFSLQESPVDILALGEGEETAVAIAKRYEEWLGAHGGEVGDVRAGVSQWAAGLSGTAFRRGNEIVLEERRARVRDVDGIPLPAWDLFDVKGYDSNGLVTGIHRGITVPILATRGCPYRCAYCSSPNMWTTKWVAARSASGRGRDRRLRADVRRGQLPLPRPPGHPAARVGDRLLQGDHRAGAQDQLAAAQRHALRGGGRRGGVAVGAERRLVAQLRARVGQRRRAQEGAQADDGEEPVRRGGRGRAARAQHVGVLQAGVPGRPRAGLPRHGEVGRAPARAGVDDVAGAFFLPIPAMQFIELVAQGRLQLTRRVMQAPLFVHDRWLTEDRNFSVGLKARTLTYWRYRIVFAFYLRAVLLNPRRWARLWRNFRSGREDSKLDSFLQILKERFFTRRAAKA
jgi:hypothetical protein